MATKKACKECARRKIKCKLIEGSDPLLCEHCQKKGYPCEWEGKKPYGKAQV
jgi:hypothetical protein